jgi:hypothetical protein
MLKDFNARMEGWYANVPEADLTKTLHMMYYAIRLLLFEVALHVDHSPEDFKAPYQMGGIQPTDGEEIPTRALAEAIAESITASHKLLNIFLTMDVEASRALPVFGYVRVSYAAFVLTKLCLSNASPSSRIGKVIDRSSLKAENFMDRAILYVRAVVGPVRCRVPAIFLALLFKLRQWCLSPPKFEEVTNKAAWNLAHAITPEESNETQTKATKYLEGPRIVDQTSSNENSPDAPSDPSIHLSAPTPQSQTIDQSSTSVDAVPVASFASANTASTADTGQPHAVPYLNPNDQMKLDQNFFMFFGDMNNFMDGTADLNDWASLPPDLMSLPDNFTWPGNSMMDTTTL